MIYNLHYLNNKINMMLDSKNSVKYHYGQFPPTTLDYASLIGPLTKAIDALARYDQMLKGLHNNNLLLAPLRSQEAVASSRIEGTISTLDDILIHEAENRKNNDGVRPDVLETILYSTALTKAQTAISYKNQCR